jgi:hypothetical protein
LKFFDRFFVVYNPYSENVFSLKITIISLIICATLSLLWCVLPYLGWSYYSLEGAKISCSVEWETRTLNVVSYNITIFSFVFLVPLIIIVITNTKILLMVSLF